MEINREKLQNAGLSGSLALTGLGIEALAHNPAFLVAGGLVAYASWKYSAGEKLVELHHQIVSNPPALSRTKAQTVEERIIAQERLNNASASTEQLPVVTERLPKLSRPGRLLETDEDELRSPVATTGMFTLSQVLSRGFIPSLEQIYLGRLMDGTPIYSNAKGLCHVAIAGVTGGGKSSIIRSIASQLCRAGATVLLLNPHYTRYDIEADPPEDWTPLEPYLLDDPMDCRKFEHIEFYLKQVATELLPKRLEKHAYSKPIGKPYFIILDELPAIVAKVPDAPGYISEILREGRKVGVYLIVSSQDFLVKTIGMDGGAVRKCFRTGLYTGGDTTTAGALLNTSASAGNLPPEDKLGKGTIMIRNLDITTAALAHVPYVDNAALYSLLGPSTYNPDEAPDLDDELRTVKTVTRPVAQQAKPVAPATPKFFASVGVANNPILSKIIAAYTSGQIDMSYARSLYDRIGTELSLDDELLVIEIFGGEFFGVQTPDESAAPRTNIRVLPNLTKQVERTEREKQYDEVLLVWKPGTQSIRTVQEALQDTLGLNFNQTRELLEEMNDLGLISWKKNG